MEKIEQYSRIGKLMINCILSEYGKKTTETNRILFIKYFDIFTSFAGEQTVQKCHEQTLFHQFLETVLNKFEDEK